MTAPCPEARTARGPRKCCSVSSRQCQRGVALLVAIMLVALGTIIAAAMDYNNAMTARRVGATFAFDQAVLVAEGAEALAAYGLQQTAKSNPQYIYPGQAWSQALPPTEVTAGVTLQASLEDLTGRFNVNNLVTQDGETPNQTAILAFQRLLGSLNLDQKLAYYIVDWIDKDITPMSPDGAEDSVYMEMNPPYRTPNLPITSTSELLAMPGVTRAEFDKLAPYIVALPIGTLINVCSASPYLLDALIGHVQFNANGPAQFEKDREAAGTCFPTVNQVVQAAQDVAGNGSSSLGQNGGGVTPGAGAPQTLGSLIGGTSKWFRLTSFVDIDSSEFAVYTLLYQDPTGMVRPVMRSFTPD